MAKKIKKLDNGKNADGAEKPDFAREFLVVGLGASAGGIEALSTFFTNVAPDSGIAYVVILHLSPNHDSKLAHVLQQTTKMPVEQVTAKTKLTPDHVYVVSPDRSLSMLDGHIVVKPLKSDEERRAPVDIFFRTLADAAGANAVGVILSGTGANGSMGLKRIKEFGGATFAQNPREAQFNEMPRNAIATELVDAILPVAEIPDRIIAYRDHRATVAIADEPKERSDDHQTALRDIFTQLRLRTGHDFSNYKRPTMLRRIERRMSIKNLPDLQAYAAYVRENPEEAQALLRDLLISVTNFFRDKKSFEALEKKIIPRLLKDRDPKRTIRAWVAGCATGEEAYSLAIQLAEQTIGDLGAPGVQIFATDIDEQAIAIAREGLYTLNDAADVSPERMRRFFTKEGENYRIRREIREMVLFAQHNLIKDPPFSHLDLITCRNLLIYLNTVAQERVLETIHFALEPGGFLFIGSSESVEGAGDLFASVDKESHIYQSRQVSVRPLPVPESVPVYPTSLPPGVEVGRSTAAALQRISYNELHLRLLEQFAPPSIVVNEDYDIVHISENAGRFLKVVGGEPTNNLLRLIRPEIRMEVRGSLFQAVQQKSNVEARGLKIKVGDRIETINLLIRPITADGDTARGYVLIVFEPVPDGDGQPAPSDYQATEPVAQQLEEELVRSRTQLQSALEQAEIQSEELRASNEELQAMNEELRSSAEELETSKEELQSINEELTTVNQELKVKIDELSNTNNNFQNLLNSIDIGVIFLDRSLRVNLFSPAARGIFNLIANDIGRPLSDITNKLTYEDLAKDADKVIQTLQTLERELRTTDDHVYMMRMFPYRTAEDRLNGVVVTFVDITERKRAEESVGTSEARLNKMVNIPGVGVLTFDAASGTLIGANDAFLAMTGYTREQVESHSLSWQTMTPAEFYDISQAQLDEMNKTGLVGPYEKQYLRADGSRSWMLFTGASLNDGTVVEYCLDISGAKTLEKRLRETETRLRKLMESFGDVAIFTMDSEATITAWNPGAEKIFGFTADEMEGKQSADVIFTPEDREKDVPDKERALARKEGKAPDERWHMRKDGSRFYASGVMVPIGDDGNLLGYAKIATDLTERKQVEEKLQQSQEDLEQRVFERTSELADANESLRRQFEDRRRAEGERIDLLRKIVTTQEDERRRIARDLHDQMGQRLTALRLQIASLKEQLAGNAALAEQIDKLQELGAKIDSEVNFLAWELRPTVLDDLGLVTAVDNFVSEWSQHFGIKTEFHSAGLKSRRLTSEIETNIYRILQEALNNIYKHSEATSANVLLELRKKEVVLIVEDNGVGFDVEKQKSDRRHGTSMGIMGMHERAAIVGGKIEIESGTDKGTTVFARIPARFADEEGEVEN